jgi:microcystin-dependent protein
MPSILTLNTVESEDIFRQNPSLNSVLFSFSLANAFKDSRFPTLFANLSIPATKLAPIPATTLASRTLSGYRDEANPGQLALGTITSLNLGRNAAKGPQGGVPAGSVIFFAGPFCPDGYLIANGAFLEVSDFPELFAAIGYTYGADGQNRFALPNLLKFFIRGYESSANLGLTAADQIRSHTHTTTLTLSTKPEIAQFGGQKIYFNAAEGSFPVLRDVNFNLAPNVTTGNTVTSAFGGNETMPMNIQLMPCIKF